MEEDAGLYDKKYDRLLCILSVTKLKRWTDLEGKKKSIK